METNPLQKFIQKINEIDSSLSSQFESVTDPSALRKGLNALINELPSPYLQNPTAEESQQIAKGRQLYQVVVSLGLAYPANKPSDTSPDLFDDPISFDELDLREANHNNLIVFQDGYVFKKESIDNYFGRIKEPIDLQRRLLSPYELDYLKTNFPNGFTPVDGHAALDLNDPYAARIGNPEEEQDPEFLLPPQIRLFIVLLAALGAMFGTAIQSATSPAAPGEQRIEGPIIGALVGGAIGLILFCIHRRISEIPGEERTQFDIELARRRVFTVVEAEAPDEDLERGGHRLEPPGQAAAMSSTHSNASDSNLSAVREEHENQAAEPLLPNQRAAAELSTASHDSDSEDPAPPPPSSRNQRR